MRVITLFTALIALSTVAFAQDNMQINIYDVYRQFMKPLPNGTVDDQITTDIKRPMANLLYPVDMSSLAPPDKDPKFRDLIAVLQQQMGDPPTGVLTTEQFIRLSQASHDVNADLIAIPSRLVFTDDNAVSAGGTWVEDPEPFWRPINTAHIWCFKARGMCEEYTATLNFDQPVVALNLGDTEYQITSWSSSRVTAERQVPCATGLMTLDIKAQQVTIVTVPPLDASICTPDPTWKFHPITRKLVDGFEVAEKFWREKVNKARKLVYPAARALLPAVQK
jgi:hypothetical protein